MCVKSSRKCKFWDGVDIGVCLLCGPTVVFHGYIVVNLLCKFSYLPVGSFCCEFCISLWMTGNFVVVLVFLNL